MYLGWAGTNIIVWKNPVYIPLLPPHLRTRAAFEAKLQKSSRATDFRVPQSICTMFNVMVDAKAQSAKLCAMELEPEVGQDPSFGPQHLVALF